jgi:hypothetical protein
MNRRRFVIIGLVAALPALSRAEAPQGNAPATVPTSSPTDPFATSETRQPTKLPEVEADNLVHYSLLNDFVLIQTAVRVGDPQLVTVAPLSSPVHITITQRGNTPPARLYTPEAVVLMHAEQTPSGEIRTTLQTVAGFMSLSRDISTSDGDFTIQYIQRAAPAEDGNQVGLYLQNMTSPDQKQRCDAANFVALLRRYPSECTRYVRPMLEHYSPQPQLFMVDDSLGASVFPEMYDVSPQAKEKIAALVKQLDADDFQQRRQAEDELKKLGPTAAAFLSRLERSTLQPEQAARVESILASIQPPFDIKPQVLRSDPSFLLDCLMSPSASLRKAALAELRKIKGTQVTFSDPADEQARIREVYRLRSQLLPEASATQPANQPPLQQSIPHSD